MKKFCSIIKVYFENFIDFKFLLIKNKNTNIFLIFESIYYIKKY